MRIYSLNPTWISRAGTFWSSLACVLMMTLLTSGWAIGDPVSTNNIVIVGNVAYATAGEEGLLIYDLETATQVNQVIPPPGSQQVDDVAFADGLLFIMDGVTPGALSVFSLEDPVNPSLTAGPVRVDVGPFSGVSAAAGMVVVSGGTGRLSVHTYDSEGKLGPDVATADLGVGQPDVLLDTTGVAYVSTDFSGLVEGQPFGITSLALNPPPQAPVALAQVGIPGAGFTAGFASPANFAIESAIIGETLFVASGGGLTLIDITDPAMPLVIDTIDLGFSAVNVEARNQLLYVVGSDPAPILAVIDVSDLGNPQVTDRIDLFEGSLSIGVAAGGPYLAVADRHLGVLIFRRQFVPVTNAQVPGP